MAAMDADRLIIRSLGARSGISTSLALCDNVLRSSSRKAEARDGLLWIPASSTLSETGICSRAWGLGLQGLAKS